MNRAGKMAIAAKKSLPFALVLIIQVLFAAHVSGTTDILAKGRWKLEKVKGYADTPVSDRDEYLGKTLRIEHETASLEKFNEKLGETKRWDAQSTGWVEEFRTDPKTLGLPRFIKVYDLVFGKAIPLRNGKLLIDLGGTWYLARRQKP